MAVNVKMGVDTSGFKQNIQDATAQLKTFDAQLKNAEATMKATGNAEQGLTQKMNALTGKLETQKRMAQQYAQQLEKMRTAGVDPLSKEYQKLAAALLNADTGMKETQAQMESLTSSEVKAADGANKLTQSVNGINRKISLDQVISGINSITSGLENAAKKAVDLGEKLWNTIMDSASRADDTATMAEMYGFDIETFQKMQKLVTDGMDTTVKNMLDAQDKLKRGIGSGSKTVLDYLKELKVGLREGNLEDPFSWKTKDPQKMFWDVGQALLAMSDAYDKEAAATALFGKSWKELQSLFNTYPTLEAYNAARDKQIVNDEQTIRDLAALNDAVGKLESSWTTLKDELIGAIAPALTDAAGAVSGLLDKLTEYLKTDAGQEMLTNLGNAVSALFEDLANIDPEDVVNNFATLFAGVVSSFEWLQKNWESVKNALFGIAIGFGALKIATLAMNIGRVVSGLGGLLNGGNGSNGGTETGTPVPITNQDQTGNNGGLFQNLLNNLTLFAAAKTVSDAIDPNKTEAGKTVQLLDKALKSGQITQDEATKKILIHDLGAEGYMEFVNSKNNGTSQSSAKIVSEVGEKLTFAEEVITKVSGAVQRVTEVLGQASKNLQVAGEWTLSDDMTAEELMAIVSGKTQPNYSSKMTPEELEEFLKTPVDIPVEPKASITWNEDLLSQIGVFTIPVDFKIAGTEGIGQDDMTSFLHSIGFANGLPWVMNDGLYMLHRGERVLTASENRSYTYNNNNYFGNVNLNNGQDIDNLCDRIDRRNRRKQNGFGE